MFETWLEKRTIHRDHYRAYQKRVDDCLAVLFCGFPAGTLPALRRRVGDAGLVRRAVAEGTDARSCSVQVTVLLVRNLIGLLSDQERQDLAQAFLHGDTRNPTYKGFKYMFWVVERLEVSRALVSYLNTEVAGQLRGMSQEAIYGSWVDGQIGGEIGRLRDLCLAEAGFRADLWR